MRALLIVVALLIPFQALLAEEKPAPRRKAIAAVVNGEIITEYDLRTPFLERRVKAVLKGTEEEIEQKIRELRLNNLKLEARALILYQEALQSGVTVPESLIAREMKRKIREAGGLLTFVRNLKQQRKTYADYVKDLRKALTIQFYLYRRMQSHSKTAFAVSNLTDLRVTPRRIREYYEDHLEDKYTREKPGAARVIRIYAKEYKSREAAEKTAHRVHRLAKEGQDFADLARKHSGVKSREGGFVELSGKAGLAADLARKLKGLKEGEITEVFRVKDTFNILKLEKNKGQEPVPFKEVQEKIQKILESRYLSKEERLLFARLLHHSSIRPEDLKAALTK